MSSPTPEPESGFKGRTSIARRFDAGRSPHNPSNSCNRDLSTVTERSRPFFDSGSSEFNRKRTVAIWIVDPADDSWFVEFNRDMLFDSE